MKKLIFITVLTLFCYALLFSQEQKAENLQLTLNECISKALENNLDISVEVFNPEISEVSIREAKEIFMPQLSLSLSKLNYNSLSNWFVQGTNYVTKQNRYSVSLNQRIVTGGEFSVSLVNSVSDTTRSLTIVNPTYVGELRFGFSQPLLKGFGLKINKREIEKAQNRKDISEYDLKSTIVQKIYEVEEYYWNLFFAIEDLKVKEASLEQSREQFNKNKESATLGLISPIEVLSFETEVARLQDSVLLSRLQVRRYEDQLKKILNLPTTTFQSIIPIDKPSVVKKDITFEEALKIALEERPEMARSQEELENSSIDVSYFKNQLLPELNLEASLWYPGQSGDRLIYEDNNPYSGVIIDKIKGSRTDALKDVFDFTYDNWQVVLNLRIPLENIISRASLAKARMEKDQYLLRRERLKKDIYFEVLDVMKELKNNEEKVDSSARYRKLMEKKLEAEEQRYQLGLVSSDWLFRFRDNLTSAKIGEIRAIINYKISVSKLEKVLGINLKTKNIKFRDYDF